MEELSRCIALMIRKEISENALWRKLKVIYSGHLVPGEGEHKIMDYLRAVRRSAEYSPNLRHCIYGLDADLVMLCLASHELHCVLLREQIIFAST